jgi:hypothetical protein
MMLADGFGLGDFDIEITVLLEEGAFCKSVFCVSPNTDHTQLTMRKLGEESGNRWSKLFRLKHSRIYSHSIST